MMQLVEYKKHIDDLCFSWPLENLPKVCVISSEEKNFLNFYDLDNLCKCGKSEWYDSFISVDLLQEKVCLSPKQIQKCKNCKNIRLARLKNEFEKIIEESTQVSDSLLKKLESKNEFILVIINLMTKLQQIIKESYLTETHGSKNLNPKIEEIIEDQKQDSKEDYFYLQKYQRSSKHSYHEDLSNNPFIRICQEHSKY